MGAGVCPEATAEPQWVFQDSVWCVESGLVLSGTGKKGGTQGWGPGKRVFKQPLIRTGKRVEGSERISEILGGQSDSSPR